MIKKFTKEEIESVWTGPVVGNIQSIYDKINELCDVINTIQKEREAERFEIQEWIGILEAVRKSMNIHEKQIDELQMKLEPEKCEMPAENVLTMVDNQVTANLPNIDVGELAFLSKENTKLKDEIDRLETELERTRKALDVALDKLKRIQKIYTNAPFNAPINYANVCTDMYDVATEQLTLPEQKDVK